MRKSLPLLCAVLASLVAALPAGGQPAGVSAAVEKKLLAAKTLECSFTTVATGDWSGKTTKAAVAASDISLSFSEINVDEGTAEANDGNGSGFISVRYTHGYLHFLQMSDAGPLHVTTVLATETSPGRFKAIHTRHEWAPVVVPGFTSRPEMYVGECKAGG